MQSDKGDAALHHCNVYEYFIILLCCSRLANVSLKRKCTRERGAAFASNQKPFLLLQSQQMELSRARREKTIDALCSVGALEAVACHLTILAFFFRKGKTVCVCVWRLQQIVLLSTVVHLAPILDSSLFCIEHAPKHIISGTMCLGREKGPSSFPLVVVSWVNQ